MNKQQQQAIKDIGYRAQAAGEDMIADNPYAGTTEEYWLWREGFLEAFRDSN